MAELDDAEKNAVSHRGKAFGALRLALEKALIVRDEAARTIAG